MLQMTWNGVWRLLVLQGVVTLVASLSGIYFGLDVGFSVLLGGLICLLGSALFACFFFSVSGSQLAQKVLHAMYLGEAIKFIVVGFLFYVVIVYSTVRFFPFLLGYVITQSVWWFSGRLFRVKQR